MCTNMLFLHIYMSPSDVLDSVLTYSNNLPKVLYLSKPVIMKKAASCMIGFFNECGFKFVRMNINKPLDVATGQAWLLCD